VPSVGVGLRCNCRRVRLAETLSHPSFMMWPMDLGRLRAIINDTALIDLAACRTELDHLRIARAALDTRELEVMRRLDEIADVQPSVFPDDELAKAAKTNLGKSAKVRKRKKACDDIPELADALANGDTTGERVDTFANATAGLKPEELEKVAEHGAAIAAAAAHSTERQYRELLERLVGRARGDDGLDTLARQRRATGFRWWTNQHDGMWQCAGKFDPVRGTELEGRIRNALEALFHGSAGSVPDDCPTDPHERHDHLAALALLALSEGKGTSGLPDVTVLIDEKTLVDGCRHEHSIVDTGLGRFALPIETIRRWACLGSINPVVVGADGVRLFLGRETRLANRAQRRALRVLYRTCALCDVPFEHTQAHHVSWYGFQQGLTDIDNLLPLCNRHHHLAHEGGWQLILEPDRTLTVIRPGGHITTHGPPTARAA